jgi:TetR/AcrR family transcriptional repressor of nem operon
MLKRTESIQVPETKRKLVDAGVALMRQRGFNATTVDDICAEAGVTKGGFFHYFKSKDDLAAAALARFGQMKEQQFAEAPFRRMADPLERVFGRLDFAKKSPAEAQSASRTWGCLIGMFAQELSFTNAPLRGLCQEQFAQIAKDFEADLAQAKALYAPRAAFDPKNIAMLYVSIVQGSLILAKASSNRGVLVENIEQFRSYLESLFGQRRRARTNGPAKATVESRN